MTMQITLTNSDALRVARVVVEEVQEGPGSRLAVKDWTRLGAGESRSFWIHAGMRLLVTEVADAAVGVTPPPTTHAPQPYHAPGNEPGEQPLTPADP